MSAEPVLCYIRGAWAYFTIQSLAQQWGDDWNDQPYDCNAGEPYAPGVADDWQVLKLAFACEELCTPADVEPLRSPWSVEEINAGHVPWLGSWPGTEPVIAIMAGTILSKFIGQIQALGGIIYVPLASGEQWPR